MSDKSFTGLQLPNIGSGQARTPDSGFVRVYFKNNNLHAVLFDGSDVQLTGASLSLNDLANVSLTSVTSGEALVFNGTNWVNDVISGSGGVSVDISDTTPSAPSNGSLWWDSALGRLFIFYNDGDTSQWVEAVPASAGISLTSLSVGTDDPASGSGGLAYNNSTGVFTYTPPDLSSYLTAIPAEYLTQTEGDARYLQLTGGSISGNISITGTVDGRDLSTDGTKLDGIEAGAQVNVGTDLGNSASGTALTITSSTGNNTNLPAATTSAWGVMTDEDKTKLDGIETGAQVNVGTDLGNTASGTALTITSSTGNNTNLPAATTTTWGVMTDEDKTKLDGIEAGADVTDAVIVDPIIDAHLNTSTATTNQVLSWTGSDYDWVDQSGGSATPAGANTQIQFNDNGSFGASSNLTWDETTLTLSTGSLFVSAGSVFFGSATYFDDLLFIGTETTRNVFNTTATTINAFGAATTLNIGASTGTTTIGNDLTVTGGDIVLGGTGRIQGIDTVTDATDAASKAYVDTAVASGGGGGVTTGKAIAMAIVFG